MAHQEQLQKKASTTVTDNQISSEFLQTRPFAPVAKSHTSSNEQGTQPTLQAKANRTSGFGHSFGNLAVSPPTTSVIQPKLTIGEPGDKYEQEADRVAAQVVQRINQPKAVSCKQEETIQCQEMPEEEELQMKSLVQRREVVGGGEASRDLETSINSAKGGGQPLDMGLQRSMGQAMGADFSGVRIHTDDRADQLNKSIQAKAFTTGQDVFFRQGAYKPGSRGGQELIAHELTHVVQQQQGLEKPQQLGTIHRGNEEVRAVREVVNIPTMGLPWYWTDTLNDIPWGTHQVPVHQVHNTSVAVNSLIGGYSIMTENGILFQSNQFGPYLPQQGGNAGHVERQFIGQVQMEMDNRMRDDNTYPGEVIAVIEIHQWNSPCGGPTGCTQFLNDYVVQANNWYDEVTVVGRFSAELMYESSVSKTHPKHSEGKKHKRDFDDEDYNQNSEHPHIMHNYPKWGVAG